MSDRAHPMKPKPSQKFMKRTVELKMKEILEDKIGDKQYFYAESLTWTKDLCQAIQTAVMDLGYERYKLVVQVTIAEACKQGLRISSRCLWDPEVDNYAEYTHSTEHMHVTALCFGLYWE